MEDEANRIKTFQLSDEYKWSKKAEPLAKAGFFLGLCCNANIHFFLFQKIIQHTL